MRRVGFVCNPIAGMGGRVGLKGTDGKVAAARARGAKPRAPDRAREALGSLYEHAPGTELLVAPGEMGANAARVAGFEPILVTDPPTTACEETTAADTRRAVRAFLESGVDLVCFVGGDGTAVDVAETIAESETTTPMLGVPAGVKIYSAVFAVSPRAAGEIAATFSRTEESEVNDIDEDAFRGGEVHTELQAIAHVPVAEERQSAKQLSDGSVESLVAGVVESIEPGCTYVFGPGSTVGAIEDELGIESSALGVDVWRAEESDDGSGTLGGDLLVRDGSASEIETALEGGIIVVSPIGGQGFLFGRGNQQLSPAVIRRSDLVIVASQRKLDGIGVLRVDTGDRALDESLRGWRKVRVGRFATRLVEIV